MKYKYVGGGAYLQGLPAQDLDEATMTAQQKALLEIALAMKMYEPAHSAKPAPPVPAPKKEIVKNDTEK